MLLEYDFLAFSNVDYGLNARIQASSSGANRHGVTTDASHATYSGFVLAPGSQLISKDGFLSGVNDLDLRSRLNLNGNLPSPVPLPAAAWLLLAALGGLGMTRRF